MAIAPKGPTKYPLGDLSPDDFELLTFLLAHDEFPDVVHVRQNDFGLDARLPNAGGKTLRGWQSKRFTGQINWTECQESVRRALAFWRPLRITFTFPKILSGLEQEAFRTKLIEEYPEVTLDWWDASELQRRMLATEGGQKAADSFFPSPDADKEELRRALAIGGELSDSADAAARTAEVQKYIGRDPHYRYATISSETNSPAPPITPEAVASMEADFDGQRIRFDATERYPGAAGNSPVRGSFHFTQDEEGKQAREKLIKAIEDGTEVRISSGIAARFDSIPVGLRGLMPEDPVPSEVQIGPSKPSGRAPTVPVLVRGGDTELGMVLTAATPPDGWEMTAAGSAGGLEVFLSGRGPNEKREGRMDWRWKLGEGSAREQLLAAEVMLAAYKGAAVEIVAPADGTVIASGIMDSRPQDEDELEEIEQVRAFLAAAAEAETWLGTPLEPPAQPTEHDVNVLGELIARIRQPERRASLTKPIEMTLKRSLPEIEEPFQIAVMHTLHAELFGDERYLGTEHIHLEKARFQGAAGNETAGDILAVVPAEGDQIRLRFYPPTEVPEAAATASN